MLNLLKARSEGTVVFKQASDGHWELVNPDMVHNNENKAESSAKRKTQQALKSNKAKKDEE